MTQTKSFQFNPAHFRRQFRHSSLSVNDLIRDVGKYFLTAPYKSGTLETSRKENLVVNLTQFDCFTFVETVVALTKCVDRGNVSCREFRRQLQFIRYRQGIIDGYSSRLHYFVDWLRNAEQKKILHDISRKLTAITQRKKINYMTAHRQSYPAMQNEQEFQKMLLVEKSISRRIFRIITPDKVNNQKEKIKTGDIIAVVTDMEGLDVSHVGFALWQGKKLHLLHASSKEKGVVISANTLVNYLRQNKKFTGIIVARMRQGFSK